MTRLVIEGENLKIYYVTTVKDQFINLGTVKIELDKPEIVVPVTGKIVIKKRDDGAVEISLREDRDVTAILRNGWRLTKTYIYYNGEIYHVSKNKIFRMINHERFNKILNTLLKVGDVNKAVAILREDVEFKNLNKESLKTYIRLVKRVLERVPKI